MTISMSAHLSRLAVNKPCIMRLYLLLFCVDKHADADRCVPRAFTFYMLSFKHFIVVSI